MTVNDGSVAKFLRPAMICTLDVTYICIHITIIIDPNNSFR